MAREFQQISAEAFAMLTMMQADDFPEGSTFWERDFVWYVEKPDGDFFGCFELEERTGKRGTVEAFVEVMVAFHNADGGVDEVVALSGVLSGFCGQQGLLVDDAAELVLRDGLTEFQHDWLTEYSRLWEALIT